MQSVAERGAQTCQKLSRIVGKSQNTSSWKKKHDPISDWGCNNDQRGEKIILCIWFKGGTTKKYLYRYLSAAGSIMWRIRKLSSFPLRRVQLYSFGGCRYGTTLICYHFCCYLYLSSYCCPATWLIRPRSNTRQSCLWLKMMWNDKVMIFWSLCCTLFRHCR